MLKKFLLIIFIILIIIFSLLIIREYKLNSEMNLEKSNPISQSDIITLLNKGCTYDNYYRKIQTSNGTVEYYYKDNILTYYVNTELKYWMNLSENEKEMIIITDSNNKLANVVEGFDEIQFPSPHSQLGYVYNIQSNNFNYLGKISYNNRPTIVVKTSLKNNLKTYENKYYIDEKTGVIVKRTDIEKSAFITTSLEEFDRGIQFDIVTDSDIKKPDLQNYSITPCSFPTLTIW